MPLHHHALVRAPTRSARALAAVQLLGGLCAAAHAASPGPRLTVDATADVHPISEFIYGMNHAPEALARELRLPVRRWGGNATSRYNWQADVSNRGSDWFFENIPEVDANGQQADPAKLPDGSSVDRFVEQDRRTGTRTLLTVPMSGWVAKRRPPNGTHPFDCGFKASAYGAQQAVDPWDTDCGNGLRADGSAVTGNRPEDTSVAVGPAFVQDWLRHLVGRHGNAASGGVGFYNLDNEPELWRFTHRDIRPQPLGYDELRDRSTQYAAAIKAVDPGARTLGPSGWGWNAYFYSDKDTVGTWGADRAAHGGTPLAEWYLQQMRAHEQRTGTRILDYLDEHYYPQAGGVTEGKTDAATNALRLRSTRALWDPAYTDESWIAQPVNLIPRMRDWVARNYPGTKLAISEYNWGALGHINGALAQADVLGIFGRERLDFATMWAPPSATQPAAFAFRMYRNVDGAGGRFGDVGVKAGSDDAGKLSVYAARRGSTGPLTVMVVNKSGQGLSSTVALSHYTPGKAATAYRYSAARLDGIVRLPDQPVSGGAMTVEFPADSITMFVVPVGTLTPPPTSTCQVSYRITNQWPGGFIADVAVKNTGTTAVTGWALAWTQPAGQQVSGVWNATQVSPSPNVQVRNPDWSSTLAAGASASFGFQGTGDSGAVPTAFALNGKACDRWL